MTRSIRRAAILAVAVFAALAAWLLYYINTPLPLPQVPYVFTLKHGSSLKGVTHQLKEAGVLHNTFGFTLLVRLFGKAGSIKAGNYELEADITPLDLFYKITRGDVSQVEIVFIEGWTFKQMRKALDDDPAVVHETSGMSDEDVLRAIGASEQHPEGLFFPDSYYFSSGMTDIAILKRAYELMQRNLELAWEDRDKGVPYGSPYDALIMASIIEKETGQAGERPEIAGVFLNRLRRGMRLQTDPTVIYGMGAAFDGNLRRQDLMTDTPYNTYTRDGLPPTPIAMPGMESILAALHPAATDALYFVGKGDGTHQFSRSLSEHNRAVARYQKAGVQRHGK
jgi:UPF0755 protein